MSSLLQTSLETNRIIKIQLTNHCLPHDTFDTSATLYLLVQLFSSFHFLHNISQISATYSQHQFHTGYQFDNGSLMLCLQLQLDFD